MCCVKKYCFIQISPLMDWTFSLLNSRSGQYCYKPTMNRTCCPQYTIKCLVEDFKISKSQKKVLKSVHKYINAGKRSGSEEIHQKMQTDSVDRGAASAKTEEKNVLRNKKEMKTPQPGKFDFKRK